MPDVPVTTVAEPSPARSDVWTCRLVVVFLGLAALLSGGGVVALAVHGSDAPSALVAFGSAALGSLASMLARISGHES